MARTQIGTDYVLMLNTGTDAVPVWKIALCQTTATVNTPTKSITSDTKCGIDTHVDFDMQTIEWEGVLVQASPDNGDVMDIYDLRTLYNTKTEANETIQFKLTPKGEDASDDGKIIYSGEGKITNLSDTFPNGDMATVSGSLSVSGQIEYTKFTYTS